MYNNSFQNFQSKIGVNWCTSTPPVIIDFAKAKPKVKPKRTQLTIDNIDEFSDSVSSEGFFTFGLNEFSDDELRTQKSKNSNLIFEDIRFDRL